MRAALNSDNAPTRGPYCGLTTAQQISKAQPKKQQALIKM